VWRVALPEPGGWRELCARVGELFSQRLDHSRPLWETSVIEGLHGVRGRPEGAFAVFTKTHHAATDGVGGTEMLNAFHDESADAERTGHDEEWRPERPPAPCGCWRERTPTAWSARSGLLDS
jgi:hypothetical protein